MAAGANTANRGRVLLLAAVLVAACQLIAVSSAPGVVRLPAALTLCFVLPGWALLKLLVPAAAVPGIAERVLLIVGGSCVVLVLVVIALGVGRIPLTGPVYATVLEALVLAALAVAWLRSRHG